MKKILLPLLICLPVLANEMPAGAEISRIENLYVPQDYDDNDMVDVVISGTFNDGCHQVGKSFVKVDDAAKTVFITPISYREPGVLCTEMISPYTEVVHVGRLKAGSYTFKVKNNPQVAKTAAVKVALTENVDDFLYPPVEFAEVIPGTDHLVLKGRYPLMKRGCMKTQDAVFKLEGDMLIVQPKAIVVDETTEGCPQQYELSYQLPYHLTGKMLIHVRSSNGQSYNRVEVMN
jgi:hypothetical protein